MKTAEEKADVFRKVPFFRDLSDTVLTRIATLAQHKIFRKDALVVMEEETGQTLFILMDGQVKITRTTEEGREVVLAVMGQGDFFGELSILDGQSRSATVRATSDSEILLIYRNDFLQLLESNPNIAINLLRELALRIRKCDAQIRSLSLRTAIGKVAGTLMRLIDDIGIMKDGIMIIEKLPTQRDLANMAGISRETFSRTLQQLIAKGYVVKKKQGLHFVKYEKFISDFGN